MRDTSFTQTGKKGFTPYHFCPCKSGKGFTTLFAVLTASLLLLGQGWRDQDDAEPEEEPE